MYGKPSNTTLTASGEFFEVQKVALKELENSGGCTIAAFNHNKRPASGFAVAIKGKEKQTDRFNVFQCQGIHDYLVENESDLVPQGRYFGCWKDSETGKYFLDIVQIVDTQEEAIELGKDNEQIAIYCLHEGKEIRLK